jgi:two-component system, chemotaxis family, sensor kinase CheA
VTAVGLPSEAIEAVQKNAAFDIVVTDIEMPEMDGIELARKLRKMSGYTHVPMIAFTSSINEQITARAREVGLSDVVLKTNRETLMEAVAKQLSSREREAA